MNFFPRSVTSLFLSMRKMLTDVAGASTVREQSLVDATYELEGAFIRLRMVDFLTVKAIEVSVGADEELLSMADKDPRYCFPFLLDSNADEMCLNVSWVPESHTLGFVINDGDGKKYKGSINTYLQSFFQVHYDPSNPRIEGDFFSNGLPFLRCGA